MGDELNIYDIKGNPNNPRTMQTQDFKNLKESIRNYGDLSGIVRNVRTNQLVGGHRRIDAFKELGGRPVVTERLDQANSVGTIARGYVLLGDEKYTYREVDWDATFEKAANLAANKIQGEFDDEAVAKMLYEIQQEDEAKLSGTGYSDREVKRLLKLINDDMDGEGDGSEEPEEKNELIFSLTAEQGELVTRALDHSKLAHDVPSSQTKSVNGIALYYICRDYLSQSPNPNLGDEFTPPELPSL